MKHAILFAIIIFGFILLSCTNDKSTNATTNTFDTVKICSQVWMLKNLDVDHYRNGDPIPQVTDSTQWANLKTGAWCYYNNDPTVEVKYGKLYNWYAVHDPRGLAPVGWHIPSDSEWTTLINCVGDSSIAGGKLKEAGTSHWKSPNLGATNQSGFSALPGGWRAQGGGFFFVNSYGGWLSTIECDSQTTWGRHMYFDHEHVFRSIYDKAYGFSVRCIKD